MSKIEWTEKTWNIITGCTKHSEGCKNCYAEKMTKRLAAMGQAKYSEGFNKIIFHPEELCQNFGKKPKMIFVNSMSDTFHKEVKDDEIDGILQWCWHNRKHTFQILTKRSERLNYRSYYPENIWLGVTVEHPDYKFRIDDLRKTNVSVKFLSCEPLLGDLGELDLTGIDWVICGGESGSGARPMHPDWVRNIQRQCQEQNVPFFFKQWGEWVPVNLDDMDDFSKTHQLMGSGIDDKRNSTWMLKIGKKKAGSLLDGKEYKEFPKVVPA